MKSSSPSLMAVAIDKATAFQKHIDSLLNGFKCESAHKNSIVVGYFHIVLSHYKAVILLHNDCLHHSALALVRPMFDGFLRFLWVIAFFEEKEIELFEKNEFNFPRIEMMIRELEKRYKFDGFLEKVKDMGYSAMCDYTHGGVIQISRSFKDYEVCSNFSDDEIAKSINTTTAMVSLMASKFFKYFEMEEKSKELYEVFNNLYLDKQSRA